MNEQPVGAKTADPAKKVRLKRITGPVDKHGVALNAAHLVRHYPDGRPPREFDVVKGQVLETDRAYLEQVWADTPEAWEPIGWTPRDRTVVLAERQAIEDAAASAAHSAEGEALRKKQEESLKEPLQI